MERTRGIFHKRSSLAYVVLIVLALALPLLIGGGYFLYLAVYICIWAGLAVSLNLCIGYMGYPSLCHSVFFGVGGYVLALTSLRFGLSPWVGLAISPFVNFGLGYLIGIPFLKVRAMYFAIGTLTLGLISFQLFQNLYDITGGAVGLTQIPSLFPGNSGVLYFYFEIFIILGLVFGIRRLVDSYWGKILVAIRDDEDLAGHLGLDVVKYKRLTFALTSAVTGLFGAIYVSYLGYVTAQYYTPVASFNMLVGAIVGGSGTVLGPLIGTLITVGLPEFLRPLMLWRPLFLGAVFIVVVLFFPQGIIGGIRRARALFNRLNK